jgi:DNA-binding PadR family transcriptional regulator
MDYPEEFKREVDEAIKELMNEGYIEFVGFDKNGEFLYQLTEAGRARYENAIDIYEEYEARSALFNIDPEQLN